MGTTMRTAAVLSGLLFSTAMGAAPFKDFEGYKDPALFTRMPNFYLLQKGSFIEKQFDGYDFKLSKPGRDGKQRVEGHSLYYLYRFDESSGPIPSPLQIVRNYQAAATKIGGKIAGDWNEHGTTLMVERDGRETWAYVQPYYGGKEYHLTIIERQAMKQEVVADAAALQAGLAQNGHVEVPGIFFDTGKAEVKPESEPALREVAKLLEGSPALKVWIVGHTDAVGSPESNVTLSNARAAAVVTFLAQKLGVDVKRLAAHGAGPFSPVASNGTEEGRAHNRRVEVVAQP